ncbi:MAG: MFS transporter, partial [Proteobacteria bacterium]|nr:MFS transporter [Pseudomonadota bacterium]
MVKTSELQETNTGPQAAAPKSEMGADAHTGIFASTTTPTERRRAFTVLFVSLMCMGAGQSVMFAILPSLARHLGLSEFEASLPFVASATIWVFTAGFWGQRSDRWGRKPIILLGLCAFGVSFAAFAGFTQLGITRILPVAIAYPLMIFARALYGVFGSGAAPSAQAYVADRTTRAERTQGVATIGAAFGLGTTIGPGIGSALVIFGLFAPFYFTAFAAFASAAAIWFLLPERTAPHSRVHQARTLKWHDARVLPFIVFGVGISTAGAVPIQTIGYFFIDILHFSPDEAPQYTGIGLVASSLAALFAQLVIVQRFNLSARTLMRIGAAVSIVSFLLFVISRQFGPLVFALVINGLGFGMVRPGYSAAASLAVNPEEQGAIAGFTGATGGAGFIFGPMIATGLYHLSPVAPYLFGAALMGLCCAYLLLSAHLRNAGLVAPEADVVDETL